MKKNIVLPQIKRSLKSKTTTEPSTPERCVLATASAKRSPAYYRKKRTQENVNYKELRSRKILHTT
jgi:hypothetical protein